MAQRAVVFDMDGVLIDSEPLWREAEVDVFGSLGVPPESVTACREGGFRIALASSSPMVLIDAVLHRFDLGRSFEVVRTADDERHGKPHPG